MKYYLHDSNAFNDEKITQVFIKHGYEGLGLFYTLLEKLAGQEKPINTEVLKSQLKVGKRLNKCWNFMETIGIIHSNNGETFNKQLLNFSEKYLIKKQKNAERIKEWRESQQDTENVTHSESVRNAPKDNISKDNISKVKVYNAEKVSANLIFPFNSLDFKSSWDVLVKEKKWRKKSFSALQASLLQLSKHTEADAIQMIKNTIAGEWQGLFEIKKQQYGKQQAGRITDKDLADAWETEFAKRSAKNT